jgi:hypothetical protein
MLHPMKPAALDSLLRSRAEPRASTTRGAARLDPLAARVLRALFELAQLDCPADAGLLARALGLRASHAARILLELDAEGLVTAERVRLTMKGLCQAVQVAALNLEGELWVVQAIERARRSPPAEQSGAGDAAPSK